MRPLAVHRLPSNGSALHSSARRYSAASSTLDTVESVKDALLGSSSRKQRAEGTIASVFASLSGEKAVALPQRFVELKR